MAAVTLTIEEKRALINYQLEGIGKGPFECLEIFQTDQVENNFGAYRTAAEEFIESIRLEVLSRLK